MALNAHGAGNENMLRGMGGKILRAFQEGFDQHLVAPQNRRVMAVMAIDTLVDARIPLGEGFAHDVAVDAKSGVIFSVVVEIKRSTP